MEFQLNPHFETLLLLTNPVWGKKQKKEAIAEIDEIGFSGAVFYQAHFGIFERYHAAFKSKRVASAEADLIGSFGLEVLAVYLEALLQNPEWFANPQAITDEAAQKTVNALLLEPDGSSEALIAELESSGLSDQIKWQILALLQQPRQRLAQVAQAVLDNIPAYDYAHAKVKTELDILIASLEERLKNGTPAAFMRLPQKLDPKAEIVPSLAFPLALLVTEKVSFCGVLLDELLADEYSSFAKAEALFAAKALSDSSKLEILFALREQSLYNLELANKVGLTPATVSHHMNLLLAAGFVSIEKRDGKGYYTLAPDGFKRYADWLIEEFS